MKTVRSTYPPAGASDPPAPQCPVLQTTDHLTISATRIGVGIDTSRYGHYAVFLRDDLQRAAKDLKLLESAAGYEQLRERLQQIAQRVAAPQPAAGCVHWQIRIDAAGPYAQNLEAFLRKLPGDPTISFGQSLRNKSYRVAVFGQHKKADRQEAEAMARFALRERPEPAREIPLQLRLLREIASRLEAQARHGTRLVNQLHNLLSRVWPELAVLVCDISAVWVLELLGRYPTPQRVAAARTAALEKVPYLDHERIATLQKLAEQTVASLVGPHAEQLVREWVGQLQQAEAAKKRLENQLVQAYQALPFDNQLHTIKGFGLVTAAVLTARIVCIDRFPSADALIGYFGIFPIAEASGIDCDGELREAIVTVMCRRGDDLVRRYLWMAALSAIQFNAAVRAVYQRRCATLKEGERGLALGHAMRKLLQLVYGVWKTGKPFDPQHYPWERAGQGAAKSCEPSEPRSQQPAAAQACDSEPERSDAACRMPELGPEPPAVAATSPETVPSARTNPQRRQSAAGQSASPVRAKRAAASSRGSAAWVDFGHLRSQITLEQVLARLGQLDALKGRGVQRRGRCPIHSREGRGRTFSVHLGDNCFYCFDPGCGARGDVIDLWAAVHQLSLRDAALDLARTFGIAPAPPRSTGTEREEGHG